MIKPKLRWLGESQLGGDSWHSLLISLLRGLAALQVAAAHLRAEMFPSLKTLQDPTLWYLGLAFITGFAHQAVVVFFLISGWLVGGSLLNKLHQPQAILSYAVDRVTRLWTVLLPTFVFILLLGLGMDVLTPHALDFSAANDYSVLSFIGNLFGLQTVTVRNFGGNYALWSLANETWYYLLFPLLLCLFKARSVGGRVASAAAILLVGAFLPAVITGYFSIWLLGVAFSRIRIECGAGFRVLLLMLVLPVSVYFRLTGSNDDMVPESFLQDVVCSLLFMLFLSTTQLKFDPASKVVKPLAAVAAFLAEFSFTLYVMHVPLIHMLRFAGMAIFGTDRLAPDAPSHLAIYVGMLFLILGCAYAFYVLFEAQTGRIRRWLKELLLAPAPAAPPLPAAAER
jgi:peptidoglycan/LPS O-acetylase OafA/YrhL